MGQHSYPLHSIKAHVERSACQPGMLSTHQHQRGVYIPLRCSPHGIRIKTHPRAHTHLRPRSSGAPGKGRGWSCIPTDSSPRSTRSATRWLCVMTRLIGLRSCLGPGLFVSWVRLPSAPHLPEIVSLLENERVPEQHPHISRTRFGFET